MTTLALVATGLPAAAAAAATANVPRQASEPEIQLADGHGAEELIGRDANTLLVEQSAGGLRWPAATADARAADSARPAHG